MDEIVRAKLLEALRAAANFDGSSAVLAISEAIALMDTLTPAS